jgi:pheromone shutdown protein TraB
MAALVTISIAFMMLSQGLILEVYSNSGGGAAMSAFIWVCIQSHIVAGGILIASTPISIAASLARVPILLLPQVLISFIYAAGSIDASVSGTYADGYTPNGGSPFIFNDQIGIITLLFIHSIAVATQFVTD